MMYVFYQVQQVSFKNIFVLQTIALKGNWLYFYSCIVLFPVFSGAEKSAASSVAFQRRAVPRDACIRHSRSLLVWVEHRGLPRPARLSPECVPVLFRTVSTYRVYQWDVVPGYQIFGRV